MSNYSNCCNSELTTDNCCCECGSPHQERIYRHKEIEDSLELVMDIMGGWIEDAYDDTSDVEKACEVLSGFVNQRMGIAKLK